ncbi:MAG: Gldg family protein [Anaerolineaceae bacterium]|nr:Gldg family protein [Anaerolineaceae bacterium]
MTQQTPNSTNSEPEVFIPSSFMLILAGLGLIVALVVKLTQPEFGVVGWGGLGLAGLALLAWVLLDPAQAKAILTGRTAKYGGTTVVVTVVFIGALVAIYAIVKQQSWRLDLTQLDFFSLNDQNRAVIEGLAIDPNAPDIRILAFYGTAQAGQRDQDSVLFDDYVAASQGKISYEFVDPDKNLIEAQAYDIQRAGQLAVVPLDAAGEPDTENAERVDFVSQEELTNAIIRVAASGDFRAYFLVVQDGLGLTDTGAGGLSTLNDNLTQRLNWTSQEVSFFDLTGPDSAVNLNDPAADGVVLVVVGGSAPLPDNQLKTITDYLDAGGDMVLFASPSNADGSLNLATADNLSEYLWTHYGLLINNDVILDTTQAFSSGLEPVAQDFNQNHFITGILAGVDQPRMVFEVPHTIDIAPTLPDNVTVTELARTSAGSYDKTDMVALANGDFQQTEADATGPFVVLAAAENTATGSRIVVFSSMFAATNQYEDLRALNVFNADIALRSLAWATNFDQFITQVPQVTTQTRPEDTPIFVDQQTSWMINFIVIILLPFGVLGLGILVWWNNRERSF